MFSYRSHRKLPLKSVDFCPVLVYTGNMSCARRLYAACVVSGIVFFFISCARKQPPLPREAQTLREAAVLLDAGTPWTEALHPVAMGAGRDERIDPSLALTPLALVAADGQQLSGGIYPSIPGFGGLYTGALDEAQLRTLDAFCGAILSGRDADSFIADGRLYTLVLFRYNSPAASGDKKAFSDYVLGEPLLEDGLCRCPVRFLTGEGAYTDVFVYLTQSGDVWKIEQIAYKNGEAAENGRER